MPDPTGIGLGLGGGGAAAGMIWLLDRMLGSGKTVRGLDDNFRNLRDFVEAEFKELRSLTERGVAFTEKLHDWHAITDPDDPAGKIWYFSVNLRRILTDMQNGVGKLLDLLGELIARFDRYNETMLKLIAVMEQLQKTVDGLGVMVANMDRRH